MLGFLRKHQRYFFAMITFVIVISFSFFGTYNAIQTNPLREQPAFTAIDGAQIPRYELDEMVLFLGTDAQDKYYFGGIWGPNFLNDGVIRKDILETGLIPLIAETYPDEIKKDLYQRWEKEKKYAPYKHPNANFISAESAWSYFAPSMRGDLQAMQSTTNPLDAKAIAARTSLFLGEKRFPAPALRQVLEYQQKQYGWVTPDPNLSHADLSLFGYHTFEDWFGPRFLRLVAEYIINAAKVAEARGYQVSKADALADLLRNSEKSYQENRASPYLGVASGQEYFNEQLRRMSLDQNKAIKIWQQVMLFRRLYHDLGDSMFIDPVPLENIQGYAMEMAEGELYRLPEELRLADFRALQKLEVYLNAVATRNAGSLELPTTFLTPAQVAEKYPELVQKRYRLEVAQVDKKNLQTRIGVREAWNWEAEEGNWEQLKKQFPELGIKSGKTREERLAALESLDSQTRMRVDAYARNAILDAQPDRLEKALQEAPTKPLIVSLHEKGGNPFVVGLKNGKELMRLLDAATLPEAKATEKSAAADKSLASFTGDKSSYYRIKVLERSQKPEILTFAEASQEGVLDKILNDKLEAHYKLIREEKPEDFKQEPGGWRPLSDVKEIVASSLFDKILAAIRSDYTKAIAPEKAPKEMIPDFAASLRFYAPARSARAQIEKNPDKKGELTRALLDSQEKESLEIRKPLADQWKWLVQPYQAVRGDEEELVDKEAIFKLSEGQWSKVRTPSNGDVNFFQVKKKGNLRDLASISKNVDGIKTLLSKEAQQQLTTQLLGMMKEKGAISLDYLDQTVEMIPEDQGASYEG